MCGSSTTRCAFGPRAEGAAVPGAPRAVAAAETHTSHMPPCDPAACGARSAPRPPRGIPRRACVAAVPRTTGSRRVGSMPHRSKARRCSADRQGSTRTVSVQHSTAAPPPTAAASAAQSAVPRAQRRDADATRFLLGRKSVRKDGLKSFLPSFRPIPLEYSLNAHRPFEERPLRDALEDDGAAVFVDRGGRRGTSF